MNGGIKIGEVFRRTKSAIGSLTTYRTKMVLDVLCHSSHPAMEDQILVLLPQHLLSQRPADPRRTHRNILFFIDQLQLSNGSYSNDGWRPSSERRGDIGGI